MYLFERILHNSSFLTKKTDGFVALVSNYLLFQFAVGMVSAFGVLFVYHLGNDFTSGLTLIFVFFGIQRLLVGLISGTIARLISVYGYRAMMITGIVALAIKTILLAVATPTNLLPIYPALVFGSITISAYYLSFHALFIDDNDDNNIGKQIGLVTMLGRLSLVVSPVVAGFLIDKYGFSAMFTLAAGILFVSLFPLVVMKKHDRHLGKYSLEKVKDFIKQRKKIKYSMVGWSFSDGLQAFWWPVYLFIVLGGYALFGVVGGIVMIVNAFAIYVAGSLYDKSAEKKGFIGSSFFVSLTWVGRFITTSALFVIAADVFNRIFSPLWWMKIRRQELVAGERVDGLVFAVAHEYLVTAGYLIALLVGYLLLSAITGAWMAIAFLAILSTLFATWVIKNE